MAPWRRVAVGGLLALLVLALGSCDGTQVVQPVDNGVIWTRLTSPSIQACRYPDARGDSLVFTAWGTNVSDPLRKVWDRLAFSGIDGQDVAVSGFPGLAEWTDYRPRWVRSQMIIYQSNRAGNFELYYRDVDTFADRRLFVSPLNETAPAPRPGQPGLLYVEFANPPVLGSSDLAGRIVLIPDTAAVPLQRIYLTPPSLWCGEPDWDPTGQKITFSVLVPDEFTRHIYTMNLAPGDSLPVQITTGPQHDFSPRWSPDGNRILFASDRTGRAGLWVVHPEGEAKGLRVISFEDKGRSVITPTWIPDGTGIIASSTGRGGVLSLWLLSNLPDFGF
jgi:hypothetical protein